MTNTHKFVQFQVLQESANSAGGIFALDGNGQLWFSTYNHEHWTSIGQNKESEGAEHSRSEPHTVVAPDDGSAWNELQNARNKVRK